MNKVILFFLRCCYCLTAVLFFVSALAAFFGFFGSLEDHKPQASYPSWMVPVLFFGGTISMLLFTGIYIQLKKIIERGKKQEEKRSYGYIQERVELRLKTGD